MQTPMKVPQIVIDNDWLNDSEEQLQVEDVLWKAAYARHQERFTALATAARAEIAVGVPQLLYTQPNLT